MPPKAGSLCSGRPMRLLSNLRRGHEFALGFQFCEERAQSSAVELPFKRPRLSIAQLISRSGRVRLLFAGQTVEHLEDHPEIALGAEVRDLDATDLAVHERVFKATAARMSAFKAASSTLPPSRKSIARRVLPSRLELKRPEGSSSEAPLAKVIFTTLL